MNNLPYNKKLHQLLMSKNYKYHQKVHCDRYDNEETGITVYYYFNNYIIIIDKEGEPVPEYLNREIRAAL